MTDFFTCQYADPADRFQNQVHMPMPFISPLDWKIVNISGGKSLLPQNVPIALNIRALGAGGAFGAIPRFSQIR